MTDNLEKKSEEKPRILNDKFREKEYQEVKPVNLHDYFLKITPVIAVYPENL